MSFLSILLGLAIIIAILFQTVLKDKTNDGSTGEIKTQTFQAIGALKDAEKLKASIKDKQKNMNYNEQMKNH